MLENKLKIQLLNEEMNFVEKSPETLMLSLKKSDVIDWKHRLQIRANEGEANKQLNR